MGTIISIVTTKGGAGKSTLTCLLAGEFANAGLKVKIIDADPQQSLAKWMDRCRQSNQVQPNIAVAACPSDEEFDAELKKPFEGTTLIDVQGTANRASSLAMMNSDLVVVPCIPSEFDAAEAKKIPEYLAGIAIRGRQVPYRLVLNCVDGIETKTKVFKDVVTRLFQQKVDIAQTIVLKRTYYRSVASGIGSLYMIRPRNDAVIKAIADIRDLTEELAELLESSKGAAA